MNPLETRGKSRILLWALLAPRAHPLRVPLHLLLLTSFKTPLDAIAVPPTVWPGGWTLVNYVSALSREGVVPSLINSVVTASISTVLSLVLAVPAAYAITRFRTPSGRVFIVARSVTTHGPDHRRRRAPRDGDAHPRPHRHIVRVGAGAHHDLAAALDLADGELLRSRTR